MSPAAARTPQGAAPPSPASCPAARDRALALLALALTSQMTLAQAAARPPTARADMARPCTASCRPQQQWKTYTQPRAAAERRQGRLNAVETAAAEAAAAAAEATTAPAPPADTWAAFAAAVSGEWEGVTASFGPDGSPIQLPEYYVPQVRWVLQGCRQPGRALVPSWRSQVGGSAWQTAPS